MVYTLMKYSVSNLIFICVVLDNLRSKSTLFLFLFFTVPFCFFLNLSSMQVTLLNECKTFMTSKFLSLSEDVKVGSMLALPKYLVEVGELLMSSEGIIGSLELGLYLTFFYFRCFGIWQYLGA